MSRATRRPPASTVLALVAAVGLVPWSVRLFSTGESFVRFAWGGLSLEPVWIYPAQTPIVAR